MKHPAKYTTEILYAITDILSRYNVHNVLDCFAGTGRIHSIPFHTIGVEIEPEWARMHPATIIANAMNLPFQSGTFDAVCTSPTYGNRMADSHNARDGSRRITYTHIIGRELHQNNSGKMQFGIQYKTLHIIVWHECFRVIRNGGIMVLNFKNHIRNGAEADVFSWHIQQLIKTGFKLREVIQIKAGGMRYGSGRVLRIPYEYIATVQK